MRKRVFGLGSQCWICLFLGLVDPVHGSEARYVHEPSCIVISKFL